MSIEIQGSQGRPPVELTDQATSKATEANQGPAQTSGPAARLRSHDIVSLTPQAAQLQALENRIANQPVIDTQRVAEVQQAIVTGNYNIDSNKVANQMLNFERGLAGEG